MPLSKYERNNLPKAWRNEAPTKAAGLFVQLHVGDPGDDCTANVAKESKRKPIALSAIEEGSVTNTGVLEWEGVTATEKVTHVSVWDAEKEGNPRIYGVVTVEGGVQLTKEQDARIKAGKLKFSLV